MTRQQLIDAVWDELPAKRYLLGRKRGERIIDRAIRKWPVPVLYQCDPQQTAVVGQHQPKASSGKSVPSTAWASSPASSWRPSSARS
jgi:hypothetical protein